MTNVIRAGKIYEVRKDNPPILFGDDCWVDFVWNSKTGELKYNQTLIRNRETERMDECLSAILSYYAGDCDCEPISVEENDKIFFIKIKEKNKYNIYNWHKKWINFYNDGLILI